MSKDFQWALDLIKKVVHDKPEYTGSLHINFFKGNISNINKLESIVPAKLEKKVLAKQNKIA